MGYWFLLSAVILLFIPKASGFRQSKLRNRNRYIEQSSRSHGLFESSLQAVDDSTKIEYRNVQIRDLEEIAILCSNTFEPEFPWYGFGKRKESIARFFHQLYDRKVNFVDKGLLHSMLVATETSTDGTTKEVVGFLEVGMLPSPLPKEKPLELEGEAKNEALSEAGGDVADERNSAGLSEMSIAAAITEAAAESETEESDESNDVPYLGNVAVSNSCRRRGIASKLVKVACRVANKWGINQELTEVESDKEVSTEASDTSRDIGSGNQLFVTVECDNAAAISLYRSLGFAVVLDERNLISSSRGSKPPRLFMSKIIEL